MDCEFEKVKAQLPTIVCNTTAAKEHVAEAERQIRTVKERSRGIRATLHFSSVPKRVKIELIYFIVFWLNSFPVNSGISRQFSPREIILRWQLDVNRIQGKLVCARAFALERQQSPVSYVGINIVSRTILKTMYRTISNSTFDDESR